MRVRIKAGIWDDFQFTRKFLIESEEKDMSKILIVEDESAIADLERDYLEINGFTVSIENDGARGSFNQGF